MATQTRKTLKARVEALAEALTAVARDAQPRPGFFVEPILRQWVEEDPEGERAAHEVLYFVVDGSEEELRAFHRKVRGAFATFTCDDSKVRTAVGIGTIFRHEVQSVVRTY